MTVNADLPLSGPFTADGVNRDWAFSFKIFDDAHMRLLITDADGYSNPVVVDAGFSIAGNYLNEDTGGYVEYPIAPTDPVEAGKKVYTLRAVPYDQETRIGNQGGYYPKTHEYAFDYLSMQVQQLAEVAGRSVTVPIGSPLDPGAIASEMAGYAEAAEAAADVATEAKDDTVDAMNTTLAAIAALGGPMVYQGGWAANAGTFPGTVGRKKGWAYTVTTGGTVGGQVFETNDTLVALIDDASTTVYAANWMRIEADLVQSVAGLTGAITASALWNTLGVTGHVFDQDYSGGWFEDQTKPWSLVIGKIHRMTDRLMLGDAVGYNGSFDSSAGTWLHTIGDTGQMGWVVTNAGLAAVYNAGLAITAATRVMPGVTNGQSIAASFIAYNGGSTGSGVEGLYVEVYKATAEGDGIGMEMNATNLVAALATPITPYDPITSGEALGGIWLVAGGGGVYATVFDAAWAMAIGTNGAKWQKGIIFRDNGLTQDAVTNRMHAIDLPSKAMLGWYGSSDHLLAFNILGDFANDDTYMEILANSSGVGVMNAAGKMLSRTAFVASAVNGVETVPTVTGTGPTIRAIGDDTNLFLHLQSKGTSAGVRLMQSASQFLAEFGTTSAPVNYLRFSPNNTTSRPEIFATGTDTNVNGYLRARGTGGWAMVDASFNKLFEYNSTGIGFFGTTPVAAKTGWAVPTGTLARTTFASYAGVTHTGAYVQATIQALDDAVRNVSQRLAALITDLHQTAGYGLLRT